MKKNRNTFFSEANMNYSFNPNVPQNMPVQSAANYNSFYSGPNPNNAMPVMPNPGGYASSSDLESRLAKMERQISRLEYRLNKLETTNTYINEDIDNTNNMYML